MWPWNKRKLPKPNEAQVLLQKAHSLIGSLMNSSYKMPTHIANGMETWMDSYADSDKLEYSPKE